MFSLNNSHCIQGDTTPTICFVNNVVVLVDGRVLQLFDIPTKTYIKTIHIPFYGVRALTCCRDKKHLLVGGFHGSGIVDIDTCVVTVFQVGFSTIFCIIEFEENYVLTCGEQGVIKKFNKTTGELVQTFAKEHKNWIYGLLWLREESQIVSYSSLEIFVWNSAGEIEKTFDVSENFSITSCNPISTRFLLVGSSVGLQILNLNTMTMTADFEDKRCSTCVCISSDGLFALVLTREESIDLYDLEKRKIIQTFFKCDGCFACAVSDDGRFIAFSDAFMKLSLSDINPGFHSIVHSSEVQLGNQKTTARLTSDGRIFYGNEIFIG